MTKYAKVVVIANQKGGVAKTTTAINLAASLAMADQRILLIDLDPQANLTSGVGLKGRAAAGGTVYDALTRDDLAPHAAILKTTVDNLSLIPADRNLTGAEIELVELPEREFRLRRLLDTLRPDFDFIFVDTPPSLGLLTLNALVAADGVLIPLNCEYFALEGIADLLSTVERVRAALNPALGLDGVLLTMYDERTNLGQQVSTNIREFFGERVFRTVIPRNVKLGEAPSHGVPVILYDVRSRGAEAYIALAHEYLQRTQQPQPAATLDTLESRPSPSPAPDGAIDDAPSQSDAGAAADSTPPAQATTAPEADADPDPVPAADSASSPVPSPDADDTTHAGAVPPPNEGSPRSDRDR